MSNIKPLDFLEKAAEVALPIAMPGTGTLISAGLHAYDAYSSNKDYESLLKRGPGDPMSTMSPSEQVAYRGASDQDISQLGDRRYGSLVTNLGSRGLLSSGVTASSLTSLQNWKDNQRAQAEADMYKMGAQRAMSIWDQQLSGYGAIAKSDSGALATSLGTAGKNNAGGLFGKSNVPSTPPIVSGPVDTTSSPAIFPGGGSTDSPGGFGSLNTPAPGGAWSGSTPTEPSLDTGGWTPPGFRPMRISSPAYYGGVS